MQQRVFIVHRWEGSSRTDWYPWLKRELEARNFDVHALTMPHTDAPLLEEWLLHLQETVIAPDEQTFLVGHSLGCITILRYLESLAPDERIGGAVLVAGYADSIGYEELASFFAAPVDDGRVRRGAKKIVVIGSDDDPYVPPSQAAAMRDRFGAQLVSIHSGGHLDGAAGFTELPEALDAVLSIAGQTDIVDTH